MEGYEKSTIEFDVFAQQVYAAMKKGERVSKRKFDEYRKIEIRKNVVENAEGSANVRIGDTEVLAGVKFSVLEPFEDTPEEGGLIVGGEFLPLASPYFETGPPQDAEIEWVRVIDRGIRESKAINFEKLSLKKAEEALFVFLDVYAINYDGNLFDAAFLASITALNDAKIPKVEEGKIVKQEYSGKLKLESLPLLSTFVKILDKVVVDPDLYEEKSLSARFSVASNEKNELVAMQKGYGGSFTLEELDYMIDTALKKRKDLERLIK